MTSPFWRAAPGSFSSSTWKNSSAAAAQPPLPTEGALADGAAPKQTPWSAAAGLLPSTTANPPEAKISWISAWRWPRAGWNLGNVQGNIGIAPQMRRVDEPFPLSSLFPRTTTSFPKSHRHSGLLPGLSPRAGDGHKSCQESLLSRSLRRYQRLPHTGSEICVTTFFPSVSLSWLRRVEGVGEGDGWGGGEGGKEGRCMGMKTHPAHPPHSP